MDEVRAELAKQEAAAAAETDGGGCRPIRSLPTRASTSDRDQQQRPHPADRTAAGNSGVPDTVSAWEVRYAEADDAICSGNPNESLVAVVSEMTPGSVLDVGCGEGADVVWMAENGWDATGIDLSTTAIDRARKAAESRGVSAEFAVADVSTWEPDPDRQAASTSSGSFLHTGCPIPGKSCSLASPHTWHREGPSCSSPTRRCRRGPPNTVRSSSTAWNTTMSWSARTGTSPSSSAPARTGGRSNSPTPAPVR